MRTKSRKHNQDSLSAKVAAFVIARGRATVDDLMPEFPESTKKQLHAALCNCRDARTLRVLERGNAKARRASVWVEATSPLPTPKPGAALLRPPASVWDLAIPQERGDWPPSFDGGRLHVLEHEEAEVA